MRKAEEVEGFWLAQSSVLSVGRRMASELDQPRLFGAHLSWNVCIHSFSSDQKLFGIVFALKCVTFADLMQLE